AVDRIELQQMRQRGGVAGGVVDLHELQFGIVPGRTQGEAAHAAEAVDANANAHGRLLDGEGMTGECSVQDEAPISRTRVSSARRSSASGLSASSNVMRCCNRCSAWAKAWHTCSGDPATAAGSSTPQCAVTGWPGQTGHASPAALSQTVMIRSIGGASAVAN